MKTHCRQWVCGHCDCLGISLIFRLTTFDVRIIRQKSSNGANRVFYISLNKGYFGKAIFSRLFSARYHILKKKKKKKKRYWAYVAVVLIITLSILATCLVSSNCSVTHVRWGESTSSVRIQTVQIGCFTSPSKSGILEKQSFLVDFQLGIIS